MSGDFTEITRCTSAPYLPRCSSAVLRLATHNVCDNLIAWLVLARASVDPIISRQRVVVESVVVVQEDVAVEVLKASGLTLAQE